MGCINKVFLCGTIDRYGVTVRYTEAGKPYANFKLVLAELGLDGKSHATFVDCEIWGKKAEAAGELEAGQLALFEGKLARRKRGEQWDLVVAGWDVTPVVAPVASMTGRSN
jgi:single-stranded DNA-binding protein